MTMELPKQYDPKEVHQKWLNFWNEQGFFHSRPDPARQPFTIVIPPPNVTGALHMGHALNNTLQDVLIRWRRMQGYNALWMPGTDHAGIATQAVVERLIYQQEKKTRHDLGREELVKRIWQWKDKYEARILGQLRDLGASCDWQRTRFTLDPICARAVRQTFFNMFKDGLIFRGKRLVNWDTQLQTSVADDETYTEDTKSGFWTFKYPVTAACGLAKAGADAKPQAADFIRFSTTRPETMLGDTAVCVHPSDERYKHLIGRMVTIPLVNRDIPIIADALLADPTLGTGCVKVTPAHDPNDYACYQRNPHIGIINILNPDGTINDNGGKYQGLDRYKARESVVADMEALGLFEGKEERVIPLKYSDRSKSPIEPYLSDQWFVKMGDIDLASLSASLPRQRGEGAQTPPAHAGGSPKPGLAKMAMDAVNNEQVKFVPARYANSYLDWLAEKRDWCISRQLWWGHRIPVWTAKIAQAWLDEFRRSAAAPERDSKTAIKMIFVDALELVGRNEIYEAADREGRPDILRNGWPRSFEDELQRFDEVIYIDPDSPDDSIRLCARTEQADKFFEAIRVALTDRAEGKPVHGGPFQRVVECVERIGQDPDVLDTWFSSMLWPHSTLGWPEPTPELQYYYPTSVLVTSRDIISLWVARMVIAGLYNLKQVPFHQVYITIKLLDGFGETMSKSKGNGVDPLDIIERYGADALRYLIVHMSTETQDSRLPVSNVCPHCDTLVPVKQEHMYMRTRKVTCPNCKQPFRPGGPWPSDDPDLKTAKQASERFEVGRNFANKIWNATRFILMNLEGYSPQALNVAELLIEDRWILSRLASTTEEVTKHLEAFRFSDVARTIYDFTWSEFCDWYLEMAKGRLSRGQGSGLGGQKETVQRVLVGVLDGIVRLVHPVMPFIGETVWQALNDAAFERGLPNPEPAQESVVIASWPSYPPNWKDAGTEARFARMQELVRAVREVRNRYNVDPKTSLDVFVRCTDAISADFTSLAPFITSLAGVGALEIGPRVAKPPQAASHVAAEFEAYVSLKGLIDVAAEVKRLEKQLAEKRKHLQSNQAKLENPSFVNKAPAEVVQQQREQVEELEKQIGTIEANMRELAG